MPKYVFSQGRVTVEDGLYVPVRRGETPKRPGVLILVRTEPPPPTESTNTRQEQPHGKPQP